MDVEREDGRPLRKRKLPRKISQTYLENAALFHLQRYACSAKQLKFVLLRKTRRSLRAHGGDLEEATGWIDELIIKLERNLCLDDAKFAQMKADSLRASGKSRRVIELKLRQKGVSPKMVAEHGLRVSTEVSEEDAARVHARKKRLGPFRSSAEARAQWRQKDLASLARAGFSYTTAKKVVDGA